LHYLLALSRQLTALSSQAEVGLAGATRAAGADCRARRLRRRVRRGDAAIVDGTAEPSTRPTDPVAATEPQLEELRTLIRTLQGADPDTDWRARAKDLAGVPAEMLTKTGAKMLIEKLQDELAAIVEEGE
jgi:hypothetical protein